MTQSVLVSSYGGIYRCEAVWWAILATAWLFVKERYGVLYLIFYVRDITTLRIP